MKTLKVFIVVLGLTLTAAAAEALSASVTPHSDVHAPAAKASCPFGPHPGDKGIWTGKTKIVNANIFFEQNCIQGHKWFTKTAS